MKHRHHEAEVGLDVGHRRDALGREALMKVNTLPKTKKYKKRDAGKKEQRARDDERQDELFLVLVQARRDEGQAW